MFAIIASHCAHENITHKNTCSTANQHPVVYISEHGIVRFLRNHSVMSHNAVRLFYCLFILLFFLLGFLRSYISLQKYLVKRTTSALVTACSFRVIEQVGGMIKGIPKHNYHSSTHHNSISS